MKKLWNKYSYAITLIILSCSLSFILSIQHHSNDQDKYVKITISEGDSLWEISDQFSEQHSLSNKEFVTWIKKHNEIDEDRIFPGEEIVIPVSKEEVSSTQELASAIGE
ncbi:LysM peptidoglycan-binding domain-containing protein [Bacillus sp. sid0103]|uniref:cell division suppressor protein YneA n=1 Tax=Bacillus sp. sid0103 TaxID=2856337 RepID=UPI001C44818D|nr:LysM peptidoglycan-binding domain-containing protein [Bacillus sp. sid0103]MBV7505664.1 LysM peptidoglycan-binding domain-containing protein [Bacillus sp. sid0103]